MGQGVGNIKIEELIKPLMLLYLAIFIVLMIITYVPEISLFLPDLFGLQEINLKQKKFHLIQKTKKVKDLELQDCMSRFLDFQNLIIQYFCFRDIRSFRSNVVIY